MKDLQRIKYLLDKYLDKEHKPEEGEELFNLLKGIKNPELLEQIFQKGWTDSGQVDRSDVLSWEHLMKERESLISTKRKVNSPVISLWKWGVAASVLIAIGVLWWMNAGYEEEQIVYQTGFGETLDIILDDGTEVTLNANSSLTWNPEWKKNNTRQVGLSGEAFFDVSHLDKDGSVQEEVLEGSTQLIPFKVTTSDLSVNVMGTAFNVMNRRGKTDVFLERGKVRLDLANKIAVEENGKLQRSSSEPDENSQEVAEALIMEPGDVVSFSAEGQDLQIKEADNPQTYAEWKEGTLSFDNVEFGTMLNQLEDIYGKTFLTNDSVLLNTPVRFAFPYKNWETVTTLMEVSLNIEIIEEENNKVRMEKK
ncbi:FecR family protein [Membranihabitans maritimus]|uniref:FecR family protein n=1 Tax=Membranihabitans maritimus TaxID=2904244 RepID=UPI001F2D431D